MSFETKAKARIKAEIFGNASYAAMLNALSNASNADKLRLQSALRSRNDKLIGRSLRRIIEPALDAAVDQRYQSLADGGFTEAELNGIFP